VIAIDKLIIEYKVLDTMTYNEVVDKPEDGCFVYGIYLEGNDLYINF
jgi:dynein heavy chain